MLFFSKISEFFRNTLLKYFEILRDILFVCNIHFVLKYSQQCDQADIIDVYMDQ